MKKIYIHIGWGKTGTSAIQIFFTQNFSELQRNNVLYPKTGRKYNTLEDKCKLSSHYELCTLNYSEQWCQETLRGHFQALFSSLIEEIKMSNCDKVVLSSEHLVVLKCLPGLIKLYKSIFSEYAVEIIFYIRRPVEFTKSMYLQVVKVGEPKFIGSAFEFFQHYQDDFNNLTCIKPWVEIFGESSIKAALYHPEIIDSDVRTHFLNMIEINDPELIQKLLFSEGLDNLSVHPMLASIVSKWDRENPDPDPAIRNSFIEEILKQSQEIKSIKHSLFTPEQEQEIKDYYAESNQIFADKYLTPREKELLLS